MGNGPGQLLECLQLLFIAVPEDLKIIRWGRGSLNMLQTTMRLMKYFLFSGVRAVIT